MGLNLQVKELLSSILKVADSRLLDGEKELNLTLKKRLTKKEYKVLTSLEADKEELKVKLNLDEARFNDLKLRAIKKIKSKRDEFLKESSCKKV